MRRATPTRRWTTLAALAALGPSLMMVGACSSSDPKSDAKPSTGAAASPTQSADSHSDRKSDTPDSGDPGKTASTPGPASSSAPVPGVVRKEAEEASDDYIDTVGDILEEPDSSELSVPSVTGPALEELRNRVTEYEASGWRVVGDAVIVRQKVVSYVKDPESAVVRACVDNSAVRVVDAQGKTVPNSTPANPRTLNVFTLVKDNGVWVINESRLATRPDC